MKKLIISLGLLFCFVASSYAQSLKIYYGGALAPDTLRIDITSIPSGEFGEYFLDFAADGATDSIPVTLTQETQILPDSTLLEWCGAGSCMTQDQVSNVFKVVSEPYEGAQFYLHLFPNDNHDPVCVRYILKKVDDPSDNASVVIIFENKVKVAPVSKIDVKLDVYPNPVATNLNVRYVFSKPQKDATIVIKNIVGSVVKEIPLTNELQGRLSINVGNFSDGIYFYSLLLNGKVSMTKKLIVKH